VHLRLENTERSEGTLRERARARARARARERRGCWREIDSRKEREDLHLEDFKGFEGG